MNTSNQGKIFHAMNYVVCVNNEGYPASLEPRKLYETLPDHNVNGRKMLRVVDESGEDYLYPSRLFVTLELPQSVEEALRSPGVHELKVV